MSNENTGPPPGWGPGSQPPQGPPPEGAAPQGPPPQGQPPQGMPPQGQPPQGMPPQGYPPQGMPPQGYAPPLQAQAPEPKKGGNKALPWIIATGVAAVVAIGGIAWGVSEKNSAEATAQQSQTELAALKAQNAKEDQEISGLEAELQKAKGEYAKVEAKYQTKRSDLQNETGKLKQLERQYNKANKDAQAKQATLRDELQAAQAKAALATKCAQVMATGMTLIYDAPTPARVMNQVVKQMNKAADSCDGVVNVGP